MLLVCLLARPQRKSSRYVFNRISKLLYCRILSPRADTGHFAVKKIAVGQSSSYLLQILREVRLLETLRHPNIVTYHHAWLEPAQFSSFGPAVPTLQLCILILQPISRSRMAVKYS